MKYHVGSNLTCRVIRRKTEQFRVFFSLTCKEKLRVNYYHYYEKCQVVKEKAKEKPKWFQFRCRLTKRRLWVNTSFSLVFNQFSVRRFSPSFAFQSCQGLI